MMGKTDTRSTSVEKSNLEVTEQLINKCVAKKCDDMDHYMKRNSLRFNGIAEEEKEKLLDVIVNLVNDKLKVTCSGRDINCVLRLGKPTPSKPRSVIVNFVTYIKRNEVYYSRKLLKGSGIFVFEDLTKFRYSLLTSAKAKYGKQDAWSSTGRIYVLLTLLSVNAGKHSPIPAADSDGLISHPRLQQKLGSGEGRKFILSQNLSYNMTVTLLSVNAGKHSPIPAADSDGLISHPRLQQKLGSGEGRKFILSQNLTYNVASL
ncbi:hypothetical protein NQ318_005535 [Aromia moschata]|uniref:Uncharacterized protein n=1 Tax=Aromia moschata TaxID=1265417 RepID=A0AAV8XH50_9CUCU|nr:hypothetical protein NQ318_005535 [Aromia moschata]